MTKSGRLCLKLFISGLGSLLFGAASNILVEAVNRGFMPVFMNGCGNGYEGSIIDDIHVCGQGSTQLAGLADWVSFGNYIYSPGDFLLLTGQVLTIISICLFTYKFIKRLSG